MQLFISSDGTHTVLTVGAQWLSGRVLDVISRGRWFETHRRHCVVSLSKTLCPRCLVLVKSMKTGKCPNITEKLVTWA